VAGVTTPRQRFGVTSVTGFPIHPRQHAQWGGRTKALTTWYVLDRAYCHQVVGVHGTQTDAIRQQRELNRWDRDAAGMGEE